MEIKVKEPLKIEDGKHTGSIVRIDYRTSPYNYTDVIIKLDSKDFELKYGVPTFLSPTSRLGKLLKLFGAKVEPNTNEDPDKILVGKSVQFITITEKMEKGEFVRIVADSLKPLAKEEKVE